MIIRSRGGQIAANADSATHIVSDLEEGSAGYTELAKHGKTILPQMGSLSCLPACLVSLSC